MPSPRLNPPIVCKCGEIIESVAVAKVHYLVMSILPWLHVKKA